MTMESFAPFIYLFVGALMGGLVFTIAILGVHYWARRSRPCDHPSFADVRLIDRIEPVLPPERRWYTDLLTPREMEIALRAVAGERTADIASALVISPHTVETHIKNIYKKLEVSSRLELAHVLTGLQLIDSGPPGDT